MAEKSITNGRYRWDINYRRMQGDEGLSVRLLGPVNDRSCELMRFDCFLKTPHYHTAVYDHNTIESISDADPVAWSLDKIQNEFAKMVQSAGGDTPNTEELGQHGNTSELVRTESEELVAAAAKEAVL